MITSSFSIVENIESLGDSCNYVADPSNHFVLTFNGTTVYSGIFTDLYGRLLICWKDGIHSFYIIIKPNKIIQIDGSDYPLCKFLCDSYHMIRDLDDIELIKAFAYL